MVLNAEQRLQLAMGQQVFQLAVLATENEQLKAKIEELEAQLAKQETKAV